MPKRKKFGTYLGRFFFITLFVIIGARLALPYIVERYVNRRLSEIPEYRGRVGTIHIALLRGAYSIEDVVLEKITGRVPVPLFHARLADLSIQWKALLNGKLVGEIVLENPNLNFVNAQTAEESQTSVDSKWLQVVKDLFPFRLNHFEIHGGNIHFRDFGRVPEVDVKLTEVEITGTNLSNTTGPTGGLQAHITCSAKLEHQAPLQLRTTLDPSADSPTFDLEASLRDVQIVRLNDFLTAYAGFDAKGGRLSIDTEVKASSGKLRGYVKPIANDIEIFDLPEDVNKGLLPAVWQAFVGAIAGIFENHRYRQVGTRADFSGPIDNPKVDTFNAVMLFARNAFIEALKKGLEDVPPPEDTSAAP